MFQIDCDHDAFECQCYARPGVAAQSLDELEFVRSACHAAQLGQLDKLERILRNRPEAISWDGGTGTSGYTPLHYAARAGQLKAVQLLLKHGADVDAATRSGRATALHRAAHTGHAEVAQALLSAGADPLLQDADGETPLHKAAAQGHAAVVAALLAAGRGACCLQDKRGLVPRARATGAAVQAAWPAP
ncbi:ankyrin repeat-containing domain protein [Scenedesmus sp. NREL 46B-D3]|nr:ankyrin repeat-containing domain protein [Scenedesmus sp. NREL 46B-D3]